MLAQDLVHQVAVSPSPSPRRTRDKQRPYLSLHQAQASDNLNCAFAFTRADEVPLAEQVIACRHLALLYCQRLLKNPQFHPEAFFASDDPREEDPRKLLQLLQELPLYCRAWHLLPSCRFGDFLRQASEVLLSQPGQPRAVYKVSTLTHSLALRLRAKTKNDGSRELVAQVYDPNKTQVHVIARTSGPQDWGRDGEAHDFLSFLCTSDDPPERRDEVQADYFTDLDPEAHIALFEIRADESGDWVKHTALAPLETNWCTNSRVQMHFALEAQEPGLLDTAIERFFNDPDVDALHHPQLLLERPDLDRSVLQFVLYSRAGAGQAHWQACWQETPDATLMVQLLRGANRLGDHLLLSAEHWCPQAMQWWLGLVATLPVDLMLEVLKIDDEIGYYVMEPWVMSQLPIVSTPWPFVVDSIRAHRPGIIRKILASSGPENVPMLAAYANDERLPALREWATLLPRVSDGDRFFLLLAQDSEGVSALHRAMVAHATGWIALWGEWCASLAPANQARLLQGLGPGGEHGLFALARQHHPATMQAWIELWRQLPEEHRASALTAVQEDWPYAPVLYRAMTGAGANPDDPLPGSVAFIHQWGACLEAVPAGQRASLLKGSPNRHTTALRRGLETGHWQAVVAWASLLSWVAPNDREDLTALPAPEEDPLARSVRDHAQRDPEAFQAALRALSETLPPTAWAWLHALTPEL